MSLQYYKPKHFRIEEFVPLSVFKALGQSALLVMDWRILKTADTIREYFGKKVIINDWVWGGQFSLRGFRPFDSKTGAVYSQHKFGRAIDCDIKDVSAEDARQAILKEQKHFPYITVMERDVKWLHVDCRAVSNHEIVLINP